MKFGGLFTAFLGGTLSAMFFVHEVPLLPTPGHAVAGVAIAIPTIFLIWLLTRPGESVDAAYQLVVTQMVTTAIAMGALADQRTGLSMTAKILAPLAVFAIPIALTALWIRRPRIGAPPPSVFGTKMAAISKLPRRARLVALALGFGVVAVMLAVGWITITNCAGGPNDAGIVACAVNGVGASLNAYFVIILVALGGLVIWGRTLVARMPPGVRAAYNDARARVILRPDDADAITAELRQKLPPAYATKLVRAVYLRAGMTKGMKVSEALRYARIATDKQLASQTDQSIAS